MPIKFKMSLLQVRNSLRVTIPKEIAEALGLKAGQKVYVSLTDSAVLIERIEKETKK